MEIQWWHWIVVGLFLVVLEIASAGGFYVIFFGVSAIIVGLLASAGAAGPAGIQVLLFSVLSVVSLVVFRNRLVARFQPDPQAPPVDELVGEAAVVVEEILAGGIGKVELRGTTWSARAGTGVALARGTRCRVTKVDGLQLTVEPEGAR